MTQSGTYHDDEWCNDGVGPVTTSTPDNSLQMVPLQHRHNKQQPRKTMPLDYYQCESMDDEAPPANPAGCCSDGLHFTSILYAVVLIIIGIIITFKEILESKWHNERVKSGWMTDYFTVIFLFYLYVVGYILLSAAEIYLLKVGRKDDKPAYNVSGTWRGGVYYPHSYLPHIYYRNRLFVRSAIVVLCVGSLLYEAILLKQYHQGHVMIACTSPMFWSHYAWIVFACMQAFFIFKHPQLNISPEWASLFRFAFMHVVATNIITWIRIITRETFQRYFHSHPDARGQCGWYKSPSVYDALVYILPVIVSFILLCTMAILVLFVSIRQPHHTVESCSSSQDGSHNGICGELRALNLKKTHRGMFVGLLVLAVTCTSIVLYFTYLPTSEAHWSLISHRVSMMVLNILIIITAITAWFQVKVLDYRGWASLAGEGVLITILCIAALFYLIFCLQEVIPQMWSDENHLENFLTVGSLLVSSAMILVQTPFLVNVLRRSTYEGPGKMYTWIKPGRGALIFLAITNFSAWVYHLAHIKEMEVITMKHGSDTGNAQYANLANNLHCTLLLPLFIMYYLTATACCLISWATIYKEDPLERAEREARMHPLSGVSTDTTDMATQVQLVHVRPQHGRHGYIYDAGDNTVLSPASQGPSHICYAEECCLHDKAHRQVK